MKIFAYTYSSNSNQIFTGKKWRKLKKYLKCKILQTLIRYYFVLGVFQKVVDLLYPEQIRFVCTTWTINLIFSLIFILK